MISTSLLFLALLTASPSDPATGAMAAPTGLQRGIVFDSYTPLSAGAEMQRRLLSPLTLRRVQRSLAASGQELRDQVIDLAQEKFAIFVPAQEPAQGYGVLVFVPPWDQATVPPQWISVLERHAMIFVTAANSGNGANVLDRREPLALLAAHNVLQHHRVDRSKVYVGGFSGGARVALRLALAYPDVFRGVLLDAGSDPIGDAQIPLPPAPLFGRFQEFSRLVYLTGKKDSAALDQDAHSRRSMQDWCVFDVATETMPWSGHEVAEPAAFDRALAELSGSGRHDEELAACRARIDLQLSAQTREVQQLLDAGRIDQARSALAALDARYGGLAAPRSVQLADAIDAR